jgi:tRNA pseudouridine55 synthase
VPDLDTRTIEAALRRFVGVIRQVPPMYSALHHDGKRLYELAREGRTVEREPREITVHAIRLEALALPDLTLRVRCGKGTYIRTLASDLGATLGCGAALASLVRTRVGPYAIEAAAPWSEVREARGGAPLWARLLPLDSALVSLAPVHLDPARSRAFLHGQAVAIAVGPVGRVRVYGPDGALLGIGSARDAFVGPERILHADSPRPSVLPA